MAFNSAAPIVFESVSAVTATNSVELGTRVAVGGNEYVYVYNTGATQITKGGFACLSGATGYSALMSNATGVQFALGICANATIAASNYGWLLTRGFSTFVAGADNSFAVNGLIGMGVDGTCVLQTISTGHPGNAIGVCVQAAASGSSSGYGYFRF